MIDKKADKSEIARILKNSATQDDVESLTKLIKSLHERVKHISVVQNEIAKSLDPVKESISNFNVVTKSQMRHKV